MRAKFFSEICNPVRKRSDLQFYLILYVIKINLSVKRWFRLSSNAFTTDLFTIPLLIKNRVSIFAPLKVDFGDIVLFKN